MRSGTWHGSVLPSAVESHIPSAVVKVRLCVSIRIDVFICAYVWSCMPVRYPPTLDFIHRYFLQPVLRHERRFPLVHHFPHSACDAPLDTHTYAPEGFLSFSPFILCLTILFYGEFAAHFPAVSCASGVSWKQHTHGHTRCRIIIPPVSQQHVKVGALCFHLVLHLILTSSSSSSFCVRASIIFRSDAFPCVCVVETYVTRPWWLWCLPLRCNIESRYS